MSKYKAKKMVLKEDCLVLEIVLFLQNHDRNLEDFFSSQGEIFYLLVFKEILKIS